MGPDTHISDRAQGIAELTRLVEGIRVAMVTTRAADGHLESRPMALERLEADGSLVFLTRLSSGKVREVAADAHVNVSLVSDRGDRYVSVSGTASAVHDQARMRQLWNPTYRAWFPDGPDDPDSAIFTVTIDRADFWDVPASKLVRLWGVAKALATGHEEGAGTHGTVDLER
jgi:general stress protein 26